LLSDLLVSLESRIRIIRRGFDVLRMENRNLKRNLKNAEKEIRRLNHIMYLFDFWIFVFVLEKDYFSYFCLVI
jgi:hypothetical protein